LKGREVCRPHIVHCTKACNVVLDEAQIEIALPIKSSFYALYAKHKRCCTRVKGLHEYINMLSVVSFLN
jgi:hypothetical protein